MAKKQARTPVTSKREVIGGRWLPNLLIWGGVLLMLTGGVVAYPTLQSFLAPADARAAFERGAVDAWIIWDPFLAAAQKQLDARLLADATGVVNNRAYYFTSRDFATRNADVLRIAIEEVNAIDTWASRNKDAAAAELSAVLGLDKSITALYLNRARFGTAPVTREILAEQQAIADTFFDLRLIPKKLNLLHAAPVDL